MPEQVFNYNGGRQLFTVPSFIAEITVEVAGAGGGDSTFAQGGFGALVTCNIPVVPNGVLSIDVGGRSLFNGGGPAGTANGAPVFDLGAIGGGYSAIREANNNVLALAGAGGGAGGTASTVAGGSAGGHGGLSGTPGGAGASQPGGPGAGGGVGGTQSGGGAGGAKGGSAAAANPGSPGSNGFGGAGGNGLSGNTSETGGGGGSGYFGGGGGGDASGTTIGGGGGGGGGSSFVIASATNVVYQTGVRAGNGYIKIIWGSPQSAAPVSITPSAGAIVSTNTPTLGAVVVAQGNAKQRVEWHLATTSDFVQNLRVIAEPTSALRVSGATSLAVPLANKLFQGPWYIRARTLDEGGAPSPWSVTQQFTVVHVPSASPISPSSGQVLAYSAVGISLSWLFSDPSPDDAQTAYQVVVTDAATGASVADTGKVGSLAKIANVVIPVSKKNASLSWKVRVWDSDNVVGNYSSAVTFVVADAPGIVVATMTTVATSSPQIAFTFTPVVAPLAQYRVTITRDSDTALVYDSGWVTP